MPFSAQPDEQAVERDGERPKTDGLPYVRVPRAKAAVYRPEKARDLGVNRKGVHVQADDKPKQQKDPKQGPATASCARKLKKSVQLGSKGRVG